MARVRSKPSTRRPVTTPAGADAGLPTAGWTRAAAGVVAGLVIAVVVIYAQTSRFGFVNYDDDIYVYDNSRIARGLSREGIAWAFKDFGGHNWTPLAWLSHMLDCQLFGVENPGGHHLTSVILHAATAVGLFGVLFRMTRDLWPAALAAGLFAVHPLRVESVAWVAERRDVLSGLLFVLTLASYACYVRCPAPVRYLAVTLTFALGLMAKPMLVTLPCVLLLLDWWPLGRLAPGPDAGSARGWTKAAGLVVEKLPWFMLSAVISAATVVAQAPVAMQSLANLPLSARLANGVLAYAWYLGQTVWPSGLAAFYPLAGEPPAAWRVGVAAGMLSTMTVLAIATRARRPWLLVGWLWFLGMLVPVSGIVQVGGQAMADRFTYLPQIGLAIAVSWEAGRLAARSSAWKHVVRMSAAAALVVLAAAAWRQVGFWRDSEALWQRALACTQANAVAHNNLGEALERSGRLDAAARQYALALALEPTYAIALVNYANGLCRQGHWAEAIARYRTALAVQPNLADGHYNLAVALADAGRDQEAIEHYRRAIMIGDHANSRVNLATLLVSRGLAVEGVAELRGVLSVDPGCVDAAHNLAWLLATHPDAGIRNGAEAVRLAQRAAAQLPGEPNPLDTLAAAYAEAGRFEDAERTARQAARIAASRGDRPLASSAAARADGYARGSPFRDPPANRPQAP